MKNTRKVALGFAAGGALILLNQLRKKRKKQNEKFTAPDGHKYIKNEMYRNSEGEIFKNGKKLNFETPQHLTDANNKIDSRINQNLSPKNQSPVSRNVTYHKTGTRHR